MTKFLLGIGIYIAFMSSGLSDVLLHLASDSAP